MVEPHVRHGKRPVRRRGNRLAIRLPRPRHHPHPQRGQQCSGLLTLTSQGTPCSLRLGLIDAKNLEYRSDGG